MTRLTDASTARKLLVGCFLVLASAQHEVRLTPEEQGLFDHAAEPHAGLSLRHQAANILTDAVMGENAFAGVYAYLDDDTAFDDLLAAHPPVVEPDGERAPEAETPAAETPVVEDPVVEDPVVEAPPTGKGSRSR